MEKLDEVAGRQIIPKDLFEHYIKARLGTFASKEKEPVLGLNIPGFKGYRYPEEPKGDDRFIYEDNFIDDGERPGNFAGFEVNKDQTRGKDLTLYVYAGGLTEEGLRMGEADIYSKLKEFLRNHVAEVRFGKRVKFTIEDKGDTWVYEGSGEVKAWGWEDKERISYNGVLLYELNGNGACFIRGF